jgi:hypothetical protein
MSSKPGRRSRRASGPMPPLPPWLLTVLLLGVLFVIWYLARLR